MGLNGKPCAGLSYNTATKIVLTTANKEAMGIFYISRIVICCSALKHPYQIRDLMYKCMCGLNKVENVILNP